MDNDGYARFLTETSRPRANVRARPGERRFNVHARQHANVQVSTVHNVESRVWATDVDAIVAARLAGHRVTVPEADLASAPLVSSNARKREKSEDG